MSLASLVSLRSGLGSVSSGLGDLAIGKSSTQALQLAPSVPLLDFLRTASATGLKQYPSDLPEEGLVSTRIGDGTDYFVDKVEDPHGGVVVVKHVKATLPLGYTSGIEEDDISRIQKVLHEIKIASHPALKDSRNILQIKGFGWELTESSLTTPFLVVQYAEHGTLRECLRQKAQTLNNKTRLDLAIGVAHGIQVLHTSNIAHGDIKLENVLVTQDTTGLVARVSDFGQSVIIKDSTELYEYWGTKHYRPPEVTQQTGDSETAGFVLGSRYRACDVYTYGLLILETILGGEQYFRTIANGDFAVEKSEEIRRLFRLSSEIGVQASLQNLVESCLCTEPGDRPSMREVLSQLVDPVRLIDAEDETPLQVQELGSGDEISGAINLNRIFATFTGYELEDGSAHLAPWKAQELVAEGLRRQTNHSDLEKAGRACLELAVCHHLGFGVERDIEQVSLYMDRAAAKGCFEARRIRHRLYAAFSKTMPPLDIEAELDGQEQRQIQHLVTKELQDHNVNPFQIFNEVVQQDLRHYTDEADLDLHNAAYLGNLTRVTDILKQTEDFQDEQGRTAFFLAVQGGHLEVMKLLLQSGSSFPGLPDEDGHTALHMLIMHDETNVERALAMMREHSPRLDLNVFSESVLDATEHWTELWGAPLHWAVLAGNAAMTRCLVSAGAGVTGWSEDSCPIRIAASLHLSDVLDILLAAVPTDTQILGANSMVSLNASNPFRRLLLHGANYIEEVKRTVSLLAKWNAKHDQEGMWVVTSLRKTLFINFSESDKFIVEALLSVGVENRGETDLTLLQTAIVGCKGSPLRSNCQLALDMVDVDCDLRRISTIHRPGWTALHWAAAGGIVPVAEKLLQVDPESVNLRATEEEERTPLHLAAESGKSLDMINLLLQKGGDPKIMTSGLKITALGGFISSQRSEFNIDILTALLNAASQNNYIVFSSDNWNILHYAATRAALLDTESLSGHLLLRNLARYSFLHSLIESETSQGWTPLHLSSYMVDFTTIRILVEEFNARVDARTPKGVSAFDIVMEQSRRFPAGLRGADSRARWTKLAYRSAMFLQERLEELEGPYYLTQLHIAAYVCHQAEVERLVQQNSSAVFETNAEGETPRQMLQNTLPLHVATTWATRFCDMAKITYEFLERVELRLEELEQAYIGTHGDCRK